MIFIYNLTLWLLFPYIAFHLVWRARKQPEYLQHIGERFGFHTRFNETPVIWLHAVSVGETRATQKLVNRLRQDYPAHRILLTHTTPTGRAASEQLYGDTVMRVYLPYDYPGAVKRFLDHFDPRLGILMETEIWPNLIHACHKRHMPLLLLNARMSPKSRRRYARFGKLTRTALTELSMIAAQTEEDAGRLKMLGAPEVSVMGNLKFDIEPPPALLEQGKRLREQFGIHRPVLLAASTREGEETLLLKALPDLNVPDLLLVIVPRHPQRFDEVHELIRSHSLKCQRRSENRQVPDGIQVVLGDSMGEMFAYYAAADLAFIGGSLLPYGGQNLIEACATGTPVLAGPHMYNFGEATRLAVAAGAAIQVQDAASLIEKAQQLLGDTGKLDPMKAGCATFVASSRGATERALQLISRQLNG